MKYRYIDCIRGYAILLVITCHMTGAIPELPWPVKRLTEHGWYGVQLFFEASCLTLLLSWHHSREAVEGRTTRFFIRRFFRIAPLYYLAAAAYFALEPPPSGFDPVQLVAAMGFVNSWSPHWMPTVAGGWYVVPGGWSIGVEFTFYVLFPAFVVLVSRACHQLTASERLIAVHTLDPPGTGPVSPDCHTQLSISAG